jgi:hypothetical protein
MWYNQNYDEPLLTNLLISSMELSHCWEERGQFTAYIVQIISILFGSDCITIVIWFVSLL